MPSRDISAHRAGARVVVRYALAEPDERTGARFTDVVGTLVADSEEHLIVDSSRGRVTVPRPAVVATRIIPPRPSRRGAPHRALSIEDLERVMVGAWPPPEREQVGGWILRAGGGFTQRANSALVVGHPDRPISDALARVQEWYASRGLPGVLALPLPPGPDLGGGLEGDDVGTAALAAGWLPGEPVLVMTAATRSVLAAVDARTSARTSAGAAGSAVRVELSSRVTDDWFEIYRRSRHTDRAVAEPVLHGSPAQSFALARGAGGEALGVGRLGVSDGWAGIGGMWVVPAVRGGGIGLALIRGLLEAAADHGCVSTHLQVNVSNGRAVSLYERLGWGIHHRYAYLSAPST